MILEDESLFEVDSTVRVLQLVSVPGSGESSGVLSSHLDFPEALPFTESFSVDLYCVI